MMRRGWAARAVTLFALHAVTDVSAQVSGSVAVVSDYLFRGVSLSEGRPAAQLNVNYDDASGWYAGGFASSVRLVADPGSHAQLIAYTGYARRLGSGLSFDAGASYAAFLQVAGYDYAELHAAGTPGPLFEVHEWGLLDVAAGGLRRAIPQVTSHSACRICHLTRCFGESSMLP